MNSFQSRISFAASYSFKSGLLHPVTPETVRTASLLVHGAHLAFFGQEEASGREDAFFPLGITEGTPQLIPHVQAA